MDQVKLAASLRQIAAGVEAIAAAVETAQPSPAPAPTPAPTPVPAPVPQASGAFYVDEYSSAQQAYTRAINSGRKDDAAALLKIAQTSSAVWYTGGDIQPVARVFNSAAALGQEIVAVLYNVPGRDQGNHSAGGAADVAAYKATVDTFCAAIKIVKASIIIEPDAVVLSDYLDDTRKQCLNYAMAAISKLPNAKGYVDAGHSSWRSVDDMAARLKSLVVPANIGLSGNVSNYQPTADLSKYLTEIGDRLGGKTFVIDTSRNGTETRESNWCNVPGKLTGTRMTHDTKIARCDLLGWIKRPGESDGPCEGGPGAGQWFDAYAVDIAKRSIAAGKL